jgi:hypothetical protein
MSVPTAPNSDLSILCLGTATADQAGRSEHLLSLERILNNQAHKRHLNEVLVCMRHSTNHPSYLLHHTSVSQMRLHLSTATADQAGRSEHLLSLERDSMSRPWNLKSERDSMMSRPTV